MSADDIVFRRSARLASRYPQKAIMNDDKFRYQLKLFFMRCSKLPVSGDEIKCIRRSLEYFSPHIVNAFRANEYFDFVFSIMEVFRSTNQDLIRNLIKEYIVHKLRTCSIIWTKVKSPSLLGRFPGRSIYYEIVPTCKAKVCADSFFYDRCFLMDHLFTERVLRYGARFYIEDHQLLCHQDHSLMYAFQQTRLRTNEYTYSVEEQDELRDLIDTNYPTFSNRRRLYFLTLAIDIVTEKEVENNIVVHNELTRSLKLMFKTIEDPLITVAEMNRLFDVVLKDQSNERRIRAFCNVFKDIFPRSAEPFQPRRLKHLCRCQIRKCLAQTQKLPNGVCCVNLPKPLTNYILLQKTEDEFEEYLTTFLGPKKREVRSSRIATKRKRLAPSKRKVRRSRISTKRKRPRSQ